MLKIIIGAHECDDQWSWFVGCCLRADRFVHIFSFSFFFFFFVFVLLRPPRPTGPYLISVNCCRHHSSGVKCTAVGERVLSSMCTENGMDNWITFAISRNVRQPNEVRQANYSCNRLNKWFKPHKRPTNAPVSIKWSFIRSFIRCTALYNTSMRIRTHIGRKRMNSHSFAFVCFVFNSFSLICVTVSCRFGRLNNYFDPINQLPSIKVSRLVEKAKDLATPQRTNGKIDWTRAR